MIERHFYPTPGFCCCTNSGRDEPAMRTGRGPFGSNLSSQFEVTCCAECIGPLCALAHGLSPSSLVPAPAGWAEPGGPRRRWRPMAPAPSHWCLSRHTHAAPHSRAPGCPDAGDITGSAHTHEMRGCDRPRGSPAGGRRRCPRQRVQSFT